MDENLIRIENRKTLFITGVTDVNTFSEDQAEIETTLGKLRIGGTGLHMDLLDLDKKEARLSGQIVSLWYPESQGEGKSGFFGKLFSK